MDLLSSVLRNDSILWYILSSLTQWRTWFAILSEGQSKTVPNRNSIPSKKSSPLRQTSVFSILVESFGEDGNVHCVHPLFGGKQCMKSSAKSVQSVVKSRRECLVTYHPCHPKISRMIDDYARLRLCYSHRKLADRHQDFWAAQIQRWLRELEDTFNKELDLILSGVPSYRRQPILDLLSSRVDFETRIPSSNDIRGVLASLKSWLWSFLPSERTRREELSLMTDHQLVDLFQERYRNHFEPPWSKTSAGTHHIDGLTSTSFTPYSSVDATQLLSTAVARPLTDLERKSGYVYVYQTIPNREETFDLNYVKIGCTTTSVQSRLKMQTSRCGRSIQEIISVRTLYAKRVEGLIHKQLELLGKRRRNHQCKQSEGACDTVHNEWFEIHEDDAVALVKYWTSWVNLYEPYDTFGKLKREEFWKIDGQLIMPGSEGSTSNGCHDSMLNLS